MIFPYLSGILHLNSGLNSGAVGLGGVQEPDFFKDDIISMGVKNCKMDFKIIIEG